MATFKAVILTGKNDKKKDGTSNIKIRITHNRKVAYISTDIHIRHTDMDNKTGWAKPGAESESFINLNLSRLLAKYREKYLLIGDRMEFMSAKDIKQFILKGKTNASQIDFLDFIHEFSSTVKVKGTRDQYIFLHKSLTNFVGQRLPISEITLNFLSRYEAWLRGNGAQNGVVNYMTTFRSLFNKARDYYNEEDVGVIVIPQYPFRKYKIPKRIPHSKNHYLNIEQLSALRAYIPKNDREEYAKDMFLLMFYLIGIEAKDLFFLEKPRMGRIFYDRFKTGREFSILLEKPALDIIEKYPGKEKLLNACERFKLHKSFYREINNQLKGDPSHNIVGIFPRLGYSENVTTKWSRHTWATFARNNCNVSKDDVALCLGHEDIDNKTTDIYIKYDSTIIDQCNKKVISSFLSLK